MHDSFDPFLSPLSKSLSSELRSANISERQKPIEDNTEEMVIEYEPPEDQETKEIMSKNRSIQDSEDIDNNGDVDEAGENQAFSFEAFKRVVKHVGIYLFSLSTIYFFEYTILT